LAALIVAAEATRRILAAQGFPPRYLGGYEHLGAFFESPTDKLH
jgi:hypothetical protein